MSVFRCRTEEERLQAEQDHEFIWGVIDKDEKVLRQLPPGSAEPQTFLRFLQQGNLSDEALAAFDPEALKIILSLRREIREKNRVDLSEWHAEWLQGEQQRNAWVVPPGDDASRSLLMRPAEIDLKTHDVAAQLVPLNYWGEDDEMPAGTLEQKERWAKEAKTARYPENFNAPTVPTSATVNKYVAAPNDLSQSVEKRFRKMQETIEKNERPAFDNRQRCPRPEL
ncbi:hypothetical protein DPSP01_013686 [Paraphaeosphaeria sporulosa]